MKLLLLATHLAALAMFPVSCAKKETARQYKEISIPAPGSGLPGMENPHSEAAAPGNSSFQWSAPKGWRELPASGMRMASFSVDQGVECFITSLSGVAGGLKPNLERWLGQINVSVESATLDRFIASQPSWKARGGFAVKFLDINTLVKPTDAPGMLAGVVELPAVTLFIKMTGAKSRLESEKGNFKAFCESLEPSIALSKPPSTQTGPMVEAEGQGKKQWQAPPGWREIPGSDMRLATFKVGAGENPGDCSIVSLAGEAGGLEANVRRWMDQIELSLTGPEFDRLIKSRKTVSCKSGGAVSLIDLASPVQGKETAAILAGLLFTGANTIFVKLTGPKELLQNETGNFTKLCQSLDFGG